RARSHRGRRLKGWRDRPAPSASGRSPDAPAGSQYRSSLAGPPWAASSRVVCLLASLPVPVTHALSIYGAGRMPRASVLPSILADVGVPSKAWRETAYHTAYAKRQVPVRRSRGHALFHTSYRRQCGVAAPVVAANAGGLRATRPATLGVSHREP